MQQLYTATVFAGALVFLLASILLLFRYKSGERSRIFLAVIVFFSVLNYLNRYIEIIHGNEPQLVVSAKLLLVANFMVVCYIMYPLEVISPGWLNFQRILKLFSYWFILLGIFLASLWAGVEYTPYRTLVEMFANADRFEVWFRLLLALLMFSPILFIIYIYRTGLYHNSDHIWIKKYVITFSINIIAYILVLTFDSQIVNTLYYYVSVGCSLYIVYLELFDRLIGKSLVPNAIEVENKVSADEGDPFFNEKSILEQRNATLIKRLDTYMNYNKAWRDPDLTLNTLASKLFTNRTTLAQVLREQGYENYTNYIKRLRIDDFFHQIESGQSVNFQDAFFYVGFRSRTTALRNFRQLTGTSPSEYFQKKNILLEND